VGAGAVVVRDVPAGKVVVGNHWPDHYMWQQFLVEPWVRAATAPRVTALQFPSHLGRREDWPPERRRAELEQWRATLATAEGRAQLEATIGRAVRTQATAEWLQRGELEAELRPLRAEAVAEAVDLAARLRGVESTRTWRLRSRLRRLPFLRQ
jgi:hypothetical protein